MHPVGALRYRLIHPLRFKVTKHLIRRKARRGTPLEKSLKWIKANCVPGNGILVHSKSNQVTQEVTGYLIPTLCNAGEKELALQLAKWEASVQMREGAFRGPDGHPYTFDTAQVMRGFLAVMDDLPELEGPLRHACEYVHRQIRPDGKVLTPFLDSWRLPDGSLFSEYTNLYVLPPLLEAGRRLSVPRYTEASQRAMDYFKRKPDLVDFKPQMSTLSHIFGYMMEALVELGERELARRGLDQAAEIQKPDGSIPAYPGVGWVCSTGMAQLAVAWYRLGNLNPANKAMGYLEKLQESDGGFHGSYGPGAKYFPKDEISWAVKFFIDAYFLKIKTDFNREVSQYSTELDENDGRARTILSFLGDLNKKKVIDIGCGKGRYLRILQKAFPEADLYGIDLSEEMLHFCPKGVKTTVGTMLNISNSNNFFDCVYSVEALEHAVAIEPAIQEMVRVLKPGGRIVIIDKNAAKLGVMGIKSWERWFDPEQIVKLLKKYGVDAHYKLVSYDEHSQPDGLFVAWEGTKNA